MPETITPKTTRRWPFLAVGAAAFAVLMTVGPIVATRGVDAGGSESDHAGYNVGMMAARSAIAVEAAAAQTEEPPAPAAPVSPEPAEAPSAAPAEAVTTPAASTEPPLEQLAPIQDDAIDVGLELVGGSLVDGGTATWEITIINRGGEYLWGVYAYLEGFGEVPCGSRQLDVDASTVCTAEQVVWQSDSEAVAWATAWTIERMAEEETSFAFTVGP